MRKNFKCGLILVLSTTELPNHSMESMMERQIYGQLEQLFMNSLLEKFLSRVPLTMKTFKRFQMRRSTIALWLSLTQLKAYSEDSWKRTLRKGELLNRCLSLDFSNKKCSEVQTCPVSPPTMKMDNPALFWTGVHSSKG